MRFPAPRRPFADPIDWRRLVIGQSRWRPVGLVARLARHACVYLLAYREAKAAEELHARLQRMSDAELRKCGIARCDIPRRVLERLDGASR